MENMRCTRGPRMNSYRREEAVELAGGCAIRWKARMSKMKLSSIIASTTRQGSKKRSRPGADQDRHGLAVPGARCAEYGSGAAVRVVHILERTGEAVCDHAPAGRIFSGAPGRGADRRRL